MNPAVKISVAQATDTAYIQESIVVGCNSVINIVANNIRTELQSAGPQGNAMQLFETLAGKITVEKLSMLDEMSFVKKALLDKIVEHAKRILYRPLPIGAPNPTAQLLQMMGMFKSIEVENNFVRVHAIDAANNLAEDLTTKYEEEVIIDEARGLDEAKADSIIARLLEVASLKEAIAV